MIIFDIGANRGDWTMKQINTVWRRGERYEYKNLHIVAVEPGPVAFNKLKNRITYPISNHITIYNCAVSNEEKDINLYECLNGDGSRGPDSCSTCSVNHVENSCFGGGEQGQFIMSGGETFSSHYKFAQPIKVNTISIDKLIDSHGNPDLIKIDVEGYENSVLKSLTTKKAKKITFEWHEYNIDQILDSIKYLSKLGYKYFSTEIWYCGKFEHDNEILNYKTCPDFINWFEPIVRKSIALTGNLNEKIYIENNKKIPYINIWGMIWVK